jgi:hypothetical protein
MLELKNLAKFRRYLLQDEKLLVIHGSIAPAIAGMNEYNSRYAITPSPENRNHFIQELLAAIALSAVSLSERESWGWSLTLKGMDVGFFVGVEPEGMICIKDLDADMEKASCMIQRKKAGLPMTQSHIEPRTQSPLDVVEQYFSEVEQTKTRLAIKADGEGVLVHALPEGNFDSIKELGADDLLQQITNAIKTENAKELGEVLIFYECRCSEVLISRMIANMSEQDKNDIFGDQPVVGIECPRCGRAFNIKKV